MSLALSCLLKVCCVCQVIIAYLECMKIKIFFFKVVKNVDR